MGHVRRVVLLTAFAVIAGLAPAMSADEKLEGKVVRADLTLCHPRPSGGGCEGTMTVQMNAAATAQQVVIKVIADTIIKKGENYLLLPQTQDHAVVVTFVTDKGQKVAKSIEVLGTPR